MLWRVVVTNSDNLDGIAPVCPRQIQPGGPHHQPRPHRTGGFLTLFGWRDEWFDEHGIYPCCPRPYLLAPDWYSAAELADMLSACGVETAG